MVCTIEDTYIVGHVWNTFSPHITSGYLEFVLLSCLKIQCFVGILLCFFISSIARTCMVVLSLILIIKYFVIPLTQILVRTCVSLLKRP